MSDTYNWEDTSMIEIIREGLYPNADADILLSTFQFKKENIVLISTRRSPPGRSRSAPSPRRGLRRGIAVRDGKEGFYLDEKDDLDPGVLSAGAQTWTVSLYYAKIGVEVKDAPTRE